MATIDWTTPEERAAAIDAWGRFMAQQARLHDGVLRLETPSPGPGPHGADTIDQALRPYIERLLSPAVEDLDNIPDMDRRIQQERHIAELIGVIRWGVPGGRIPGANAGKEMP